MDQTQTKQLLQQVRDGKISVEDAVLQLRITPFEDLGFAKVDHHRALRQGAAEVIYGSGKTAEQIVKIAESLLSQGAEAVLVTRIAAEVSQEINQQIAMRYFDVARIGIIGKMPAPNGAGQIVVATGGTSDMPVAEEAAVSAEALGNRVVRLYDVGVAGLHRLLSNLEPLMSARVVIAIAGMEGALASVIGGLVDCPVVAVPTSVGYGASFGGVTALLSMLNSCASGVSVVNIDNGFGAGYLASMINHTDRENV